MNEEARVLLVEFLLELAKYGLIKIEWKKGGDDVKGSTEKNDAC